MHLRQAVSAAILLTALVCLLAAPNAQSADKYKARLSPLGVTGATVNTITGSGSVTATLQGTKLTIEGTFDGLTGSATTANIRRALKALAGPVVFEITELTKASKGTIAGTFELKPDQVEDLKAGRLYVQIHSERAPEGSIRGWLLK
ncbi:MAG TPA: CHRD domain-containing protein [Vicinamibacterales bacterium]|nr:CHRD domain-containing protein [Vicinamibacterales bacterium]